MKKPKLLFKVNRDNRGKLYFNHKWIKDVTKIDIHGEPWEYTLTIERYRRDSDNKYIISGGEIQRYVSTYHFGKGGD